LNFRAVISENFDAVDRAFSKQSGHFDEEDFANPVLADLRKQVYAHLTKYIKPQSHVLELNAGTGIDAAYFVRQGHTVLATDLATGMIEQITRRIDRDNLHGKLSCQQLSYDNLDAIQHQKFDYVFSNSGGLNCIRDLKNVTQHFALLLNPGAYITFVIMPPVYLWEWLGLFKGRVRDAFRRLHKEGVIAHLEGEYFRTYYHSQNTIRKAFDDHFQFIASEGLAAISPPPHRGDFPDKHPRLYQSLRKVDNLVNTSFPFDRWADHIIVTFQYKG
jgi:SAM-dependent methyltransferase